MASARRRFRLDRIELPPDGSPITTAGEAGTYDVPDEVGIIVNGDRRLEHLLVCLPPAAEVVSPVEYKELRREHARRLLG